MVKVVGEDEQLAWDLKTPPRKRKKRPGPKRDPRKRDPEHRTRPAHAQREPVHVVLRVLDDVPRLRGFEGYRAIRGALQRIAIEGFRAVHTSIQQSHLHFLVEADDRRALSRGMQGLAISIAKRINFITKRRGKVFAFRYHATAIRTPTQARRALNYVLNNWRHHQESASAYAKLDPFATGHAFDGWSEATWWYDDWEPIPSAPPETWLLRVGWQRGGGAISPRAYP